MKDRRKILLFAVSVCLLFLSFRIYRQVFLKDTVSPATSTEKTVEVSIGHKVIKALIVSTPALRNKGLGGRNSLMPYEGMLFVFDSPEAYGFWMKDMKFSLDILWIDQGHRVVSVAENVLPSSYPKVFVPESSVEVVLEVNAGFVKENKIKIGDQVFF